MKAIKRLFSFIFLIILFLVVIIGYNGYRMYKDAVTNTPIENKILEIKKSKNYTKLDDMDKMFIDAVIAVEDHRFYEHKGIDLLSTISAAFVDIKEKELVTGGSSITQQLAKNMYFSQEKKFSRKFAEIFVVSYLEEHLSKYEILEIYLNTIYYGNGYYGIGNASIGYFDKLPNNLTKSEAVTLAGLPKAPSVYSLTENENLALNRQQQVIDAMVRYGYIKKEDVDFFKEN